MYRTLKKLFLLFAFVCALCCFAVACGDNENPPADDDGKVSYSVTVTAEEGFDISSVKAQWMSGTETASEEIALDAEGKASVELDSGAYTVTLKGVPSGYTFQPAVVTAENPAATIAITVVTVDYNITVTFPTDITPPQSVKVQLYSGETEVGAATEITEGKATINVRGGDYTAKVIGLPDYLQAADATVSLGNRNATIAVSFKQVEYTVTVTVANGVGVPEGASVALYSGTTKVGTEVAIDSSSVEAKFNITAGNYTARVSGLGALYHSDEATLTYTQRTGAIAITANTVTFTLDVPDYITISDYTALEVDLFEGTRNRDASESSVLDEPVKFDAQGVAAVVVMAGDYVAKFSGFASGVGAADIIISQTDTDVTVPVYYLPTGGDARYDDYSGMLSGTPYGFTETGDYIVQTQIVSVFGSPEYATKYIGFTAEEDGLYTFSWDDDDVVFVSDYADSDSYEYKKYVTKSDYGAQYALQAGEKFAFEIGFNKDISYYNYNQYVIVNLVIEEYPAAGAEFNPKAVTEGANTTEVKGAAWFNLPMAESGYQYYITYDSAKMSAQVYMYDNASWTFNWVDIASEELLSLSEWSTTQLKITANDADTEITFTFVKQVKSGAFDNPIALTLGTEETYHFTDMGNAWYNFTTPDDGKTSYRIWLGANFNGITIYSSVSDEYKEGETTVGSGPIFGIGESVITLQPNTKYWAMLHSNNGLEVSFTIDDFDPATEGVEGEPWKPFEVGEGTHAVVTLQKNGAEVKSGSVYFKYTATKSGDLIIAPNNRNVEGLNVDVINLNENFTDFMTEYMSKFDRFSNRSANPYAVTFSGGKVTVTAEETVWFYISYNFDSAAVAEDSYTVNINISVIEEGDKQTASVGDNSLAGADGNVKTVGYKYTATKACHPEITFPEIEGFTADVVYVSGSNIASCAGFVAEGNDIYFTVTYCYTGDGDASQAKFVLTENEPTEAVAGDNAIGDGDVSVRDVVYVYTATATAHHTISVSATNGIEYTIICYDESGNVKSRAHNFVISLDTDAKIYFHIYAEGFGEFTLNITALGSSEDITAGEAKSLDDATSRTEKIFKFIANKVGWIVGVVTGTESYSIQYFDESWSPISDAEDGLAVISGDVIYMIVGYTGSGVQFSVNLIEPTDLAGETTISVPANNTEQPQIHLYKFTASSDGVFMCDPTDYFEGTCICFTSESDDVTYSYVSSGDEIYICIITYPGDSAVEFEISVQSDDW